MVFGSVCSRLAVRQNIITACVCSRVYSIHCGQGAVVGDRDKIPKKSIPNNLFPSSRPSILK